MGVFVRFITFLQGRRSEREKGSERCMQPSKLQTSNAEHKLLRGSAKLDTSLGAPRMCLISWRSLGESNPCFSLERAAS